MSSAAPGSVAWAVGAFAAVVREEWRHPRAWAAFIVASVATLLVLFSLDLPGGVPPALPILFMPLAPHSIRLLVRRLCAAAITLGVTYLVATTLSQQPWAVLSFAALLAFVGLYLVGRGRDLMTYAFLALLPTLLAWSTLVRGESIGHYTATLVAQVLIGILVSGGVGVVMLRHDPAASLRRMIAADLASVAAALRQPVDAEPRGQAVWSSARSAAMERLLRAIRVADGAGGEQRRLHLLADGARLVASWNGARLMARSLDPDPQHRDRLAQLAMPVRRAAAEELDALAEAVQAQREAPPAADLAARIEALRAALPGAGSPAGRADARERAFTASIAALYAGLPSLLQAVRAGTGRGDAPPDLALTRLEDRSDLSTLQIALELLGRPQPAALLFALKGVLVGVIAFVIASIFSWWGGASVLLLMSLLLTSLNMGSVAAGFVLRMVGLFAALLATLLFLLVAMPLLQDPWLFLLALSAVLLPGAAAMHRPATAPMGLSYAMSVFFVLASEGQPEISLVPLQQRFGSVAGATLLSWAVFLLVRPVYARQRIGESLSTAMSELGGLADAAAASLAGDPAAPSPRDEARMRLRAVGAIDDADRVIEDAALEMAREPRRAESLRAIRRETESLMILLRLLLRLARTIAKDRGGIGPAASASAVAYARSLGGDLRSLAAFASHGTNASPLPQSGSADAAALLRREIEQSSDAIAAMALLGTTELIETRMAALQAGLEARREALTLGRPIAIGGEHTAHAAMMQ